MIKKILKILIAVLISVGIICGAVLGGMYLTYTPKLTFDFSQRMGEVTSGASGYLYGLAERGVPSSEMAESLDISSVSQKVKGGLQHPIGDVDNVYSTLPDTTDYVCVYLQDVYDTWYYKHDDIIAQREAGDYDWQKLLDENYLPKVKNMVEDLMYVEYTDKIVYCLYNECDNGVWFGKTEQGEDGIWCNYDDSGKDAFNSAWKQTYDLVKSINPNAIIGGPGFCDFEWDEMDYFVKFCAENDCVPDVMIYHELDAGSLKWWQTHADDCRSILASYNIDEKPILVSEYGRTWDNGMPGAMAKYISCIEYSGVYGDNAYWRLSNNLNDSCADDNSPNSNWWIMRWYADMTGDKVASLGENKKAERKNKKKNINYTPLMGLATIDDEKGRIEAVFGGEEGKYDIVFDELNDTSLAGKRVNVKVEETVYKGLYGVVNEPVLITEFTDTLDNKLTISADDLDEANGYHIVITEAEEDREYITDYLPVRYEIEDGIRLGDAYTYDSYCPSTFTGECTDGEYNDLVGGMEKIGDGAQLTIEAPADGNYTIDIIYGNANDGPVDEETGRQNPNDRADALVNLAIDDEEQIIALPNTIKSEYTSCYSVTQYLTEGEHTISFTHNEGTYVLDSLVLQMADDSKSIAALSDEDRSGAGVTSYLAIADKDGYYTVTTAPNTTIAIASGVATTDEKGVATLYLKRGLNYLDISADSASIDVAHADAEPLAILTPADAILGGTAEKHTNENGVTYIYGISCDGGSAAYSVDADERGTYAVTLTYSNNDEGGVHDYNVDLVERYVTASVNGKKVGNYYCRNTYSWQTFKTVTFYVELDKGKNILSLSNDGTERFNGKETYAPYISTIVVAPIQK